MHSPFLLLGLSLLSDLQDSDVATAAAAIIGPTEPVQCSVSILVQTRHFPLQSCRGGGTNVALAEPNRRLRDLEFESGSGCGGAGPRAC